MLRMLPTLVEIAKAVQEYPGTAVELASRASVHARTVRRFIHGEYGNPYYDTVRKLVQGMDTPALTPELREALRAYVAQDAEAVAARLGVPPSRLYDLLWGGEGMSDWQRRVHAMADRLPPYEEIVEAARHYIGANGGAMPLAIELGIHENNVYQLLNRRTARYKTVQRLVDVITHDGEAPPVEDYDVMYEKVARFIERNGLRELARRAGLGIATVHRVYHRQFARSPTYRTLKKLSEVVDASVFNA